MSASATFTHRFTVRLHDTDAAGVMFYGHLFRHAHDAYEAFMTELGLPLAQMVGAAQWHLPLVHAEADYEGAMRHGDEISIDLDVAHIGRSAFTLAYRFAGRDRRRLATARTVHACVAPGDHTSLPLPRELREALSTCCRDTGDAGSAETQ